MKTNNITHSAILLALTFFPLFTNAASDHLEPLGLSNKEQILLYNSLVKTSDINEIVLWMTKDPALSSVIEAVVIDAKIEFELVDEYTQRIKSMKFYLRCVSTVPQIPYDPARRYETVGLDNLDRHEIPIEEAFADLMQEAWEKVLKQTRYSHETYMYLGAQVSSVWPVEAAGNPVSPDCS